MKLTETKFPNQLQEIGQTMDVKFAWAKKTKQGYTNNMPFVKCRDFLGDSLWAEETNTKRSIYGFSYDPAKQKMYKRNTVLLIKFPNNETLITFQLNVVPFLFKYVDLASAPFCSIMYDHDSNIALIRADSIWKKTIVGISAFTFILKCCCYPLDKTKPMLEAIKEIKVDKKNWDGNTYKAPPTEAAYVVDKFDLLIKNLRKITKKMSTVHGLDNPDINTVHNSAGFVTVCKFGTGEFGKYLSECK